MVWTLIHRYLNALLLAAVAGTGVVFVLTAYTMLGALITATGGSAEPTAASMGTWVGSTIAPLFLGGLGAIHAVWGVANVVGLLVGTRWAYRSAYGQWTLLLFCCLCPLSLYGFLSLSRLELAESPSATSLGLRYEGGVLELDPSRLIAVRRWLRFRAALAMLGALPAGAWGLFFTVLFVIHLAYFFSPDRLDNAGVLAIAGLGPLAIALGAFGFAWRDERLLALLRALERAHATLGAFDAEGLSRVLGIPIEAAHRQVARGVELDVLRPQLTAQLATSGVRPAATPSLPPSSGRVAVGEVVGSYRIERPLGAGGMGAVFVARHLRTQRLYALKTLHPTLLPDAAARARFEREALAAGGLGHPGLVAVHDYGVTTLDEPYLVMDLLQGETLEERLLRDGPAPIAVAVPILCDLCAAIGAAHAQRIVHRDLKPSNVFLAAATGLSERVVVLDFGLARPTVLGAHEPKLTRTGEAVGTPLYMAPEQARGELVDERADVYALGAIGYELLSGAPPFFEPTLAQVHARLLREDAPPLRHHAPHVPAELEAAIGWALARDPTRRCPSVAELAAALRQAHSRGRQVQG